MVFMDLLNGGRAYHVIIVTNIYSKSNSMVVLQLVQTHMLLLEEHHFTLFA
jgi:hypothetical protein